MQCHVTRMTILSKVNCLMNLQVVEVDWTFSSRIEFAGLGPILGHIPVVGASKLFLSMLEVTGRVCGRARYLHEKHVS